MPLSAGTAGGAYPGLVLKAWTLLALNGGVLSMVKQQGVATAVRFGLGLYDLTFSSAMSGTNYVIDFGADYATMAPQSYLANKTVNGCRIGMFDGSVGSTIDISKNLYVAFYE